MSASLPNEPGPKHAEPVLTPKLSAAWALRLSHVGIAAFFALFFLLFSYLPLRGTDLWGHTLFGEWILEHRALPTEDPYFKLAQGMEVVDSAWLSQVLFAWVEQQAGPNGLSILFASLSLATLLVLARAFYLQSHRLLPMMVGAVVVIIVGWSRATTLRPEAFGGLLFAVLIWLVTRSEQNSSEVQSPAQRTARLLTLWLGLPVLFCLWANLHGSYICGLIFLGCCLIGRAIDVAWTSRSALAVVQDPAVQRWAFLSELALVATFINPYGIELLVYNLRFAQNANLATILEWQPLLILGVGGIEFFFSWIVLLFVWRHSKARISAAQLLVLAAFSLLSIKSMRMLGWYAPAFAWAIGPHVADIWARYWPAAPAPEPQPVGGPIVIPPGQSFRFTLVAALLVWIGFSLSPLGTLVLGGKPRTADRLFDEASTPLNATAYLVKQPPAGQTFHPQQWGDWFVMQVPKFQPFVTSNIHLAPPQVWEDYLRIGNAQPGWQRVLDRYNISTLIVDKKSQPMLLQGMTQATNWKRVFDDKEASIYERHTNTGATALPPAPLPAADEAPGGETPLKPENNQ
ncbi:MAG TPA: hypothetical protein VL096_07445 [Pirellulaceae bacterium]|nr:hypothetical protein [Pirellulaceae bacterium]